MFKFWAHSILIGSFFLGFIVNAQTKLAQLDSLYAVGEYSKAIQLYQGQTPHLFNEKLGLAKVYLAKQQTELALDLYQAALAQKPVTKHRFTFAKLLLDEKKYVLADSVLTQLHIDYPKNAEFVYQLGMSKKTRNNTTLDQYFSKAISLDSTHLRAYFELAHFYTKIKSYNKAINTCKMALKIKPDHKKILGLIGQVLFNDKAFHAALSYFKQLDETHGVPQFVLEKMAYCSWMTRDFNAAEVYYKRLLQLEPKSFLFHQNLSKTLNILGKHALAMSHAFSAQKYKDVSLYKINFELGQAYLGLKQYRLAMSHFIKVIEELPSYEKAYVRLARAADIFYDDKSKVIPYFENYQERFSDSETADYKDFMIRRYNDIKQKIHFDSAKK